MVSSERGSGRESDGERGRKLGEVFDREPNRTPEEEVDEGERDRGGERKRVLGEREKFQEDGEREEEDGEVEEEEEREGTEAEAET